MYAEFDNTLITGNELIDSQHRELFEKINNLFKVCENASGKVTAIRTLDYLSEYTNYHFEAEEKLQEELGYPGLEEHKKKHDELRKVVDELYVMLEEEEGPTDAFVTQVQKNVVDWLCVHIKCFDRSVAEFKNLSNNADIR